MQLEPGLQASAVREERCRVLVGGFGAPGRRDLDFGAKFIAFAEGLQWPQGVVVEDLSYAAHLVLHRLLELRPAKVILVGAVHRGLDPPGTIRRYELALAPPPAEEVHQALTDAVGGTVDLDHTLAVIRHWGCLPADSLMIEVEAADTSFGLGFSEELGAAIDPILAMLGEELDDQGGGSPETAGSELDAHPVPRTEGACLAQRDRPPASDGTSSTLPGLGQLVDYAHVHEEVGRVEALQHRLPKVGRIALAGRFRAWGAGLRVGGDWYDAIPVEDDVLALVVGDVVGRGVHAASAMAQLRTAVRAFALLEGDRPARIMEHLDRLVESVGVGEATTLVYLTVNSSSGEVVISNAGQCPPLLVTPGGSAEFLTEGLSAPLGTEGWSAPLGTPGGRARQEATVRLVPGSTLLLFTDGLVESRSKPLDDGLERLRLASASGPAELELLCDHVLSLCVDGQPQDDDVSVVAMRFGP